MKTVGVTGPDFMPRLFDISEPVAAHDGVVVDVMAASVNPDFSCGLAGSGGGGAGRLVGLLVAGGYGKSP
ncbi:MAG TPA: hypothetical protein VNY55_18900, partial [Mycobacterium sp.]|nr:hypothetical protein [Mycobacterium sp.]